MSVHIVLHHEPSLVEETHLEIDWVDLEEDNDLDAEVIIDRSALPRRQVRKVKVTIKEE